MADFQQICHPHILPKSQKYSPSIQIAQKLLQLGTLNINCSRGSVVFDAVAEVAFQNIRICWRYFIVMVAVSSGAAKLVDVIQKSNCPAGRTLLFCEFDCAVCHIQPIALQKVYEPCIRTVDLHRVLSAVVCELPKFLAMPVDCSWRKIEPPQLSVCGIHHLLNRYLYHFRPHINHPCSRYSSACRYTYGNVLCGEKPVCFLYFLPATLKD